MKIIITISSPAIKCSISSPGIIVIFKEGFI